MPGITELWDKARSRPVSCFRKVFFFRLLLFCPCSIEQTRVFICMMLKFHAQKSYAVNLFDIYGSLKKKGSDLCNTLRTVSHTQSVCK